MKRTSLPKPHLEYIREIKDLLPKEAFLSDPKKMFYIVGYALLLLIAYTLFRFTHTPFVYLPLSCLIAHCLSCLGFLSHELSHNCIIRNSRCKYIVEVISW